MVTRIKICGITNARDADLALELGANALGFVFEPSSPRFVDHFEGARDLPKAIGPMVTTFAVYGKLRDEATGCRYRQFVKAGPMTSMVDAVLAIRPEKSKSDEVVKALERMDRWMPPFYFLDAFDKDAFGGTGKRADWDLAAELVRLMPDRKLVLAGGLDPDNVAEAIAKVRPYAVDVSSGVEAKAGVKDPGKLKAFIQAVRGAAR